MISMTNLAAGIACLTAAVALTGSPAAADQREKVFAGIEPGSFAKEWKFDDWQVWAMPDGSCLALEQDTGWETFHFWGFRQSPGSRIKLYFGSIEHARPQTVQMSFNNGGEFDYDAQVERFRDWDAYEISIQANALSVFPRQLTIVAHVNGQRVFLNVYNSMDRVRDHMAKCLAWQQTN